MQIHMGMDIRQHCPSRHKGALGGFRGSTIQKYGEVVRLAPTLVHVCGFIWKWTYAKYKSPLNTPGGISGGGGLGCRKFKSLGKLSNGWTDWPQIWDTSADPSGNGYTPNKLPLETQGGTWGVLGVKHSKVLGSCQTAGSIGTNFGSRGFIWEWTQAKSKSPLNTPRGHFGGGGVVVTNSKTPGGILGGHKFNCMGKL